MSTHKFGTFQDALLDRQIEDIVSAIAAVAELLQLNDKAKLRYGAMYCEDAAINMTVASNHVYYPIASGLSDGGSDGFTFQNGSELLCQKAGVYKVDWSLSLSTNQSDQTVGGLVMVNSTGAPNASNATRAKENGVVYSIGGSGILTLAVNDVVKLAVEKENGTSSTFTINHAALTVFQIGVV